jgi:hypothetical protein
MHTIGKILSAPFDRRAWGNRIVTLLVAYAIVGGIVGVLALADFVARWFAS